MWKWRVREWSRAEDQPADITCPDEFPTPGVLTIDALSAPPHSVPAQRQLKTLVYMADGAPVVAVIRGDDTLKEAKLQLATGAAAVRPARADEVLVLLGAHPGSLGAVRLNVAPVLVEQSLLGRTNLVTGANRDGFPSARS
jgi:prolyl-tRNA synthetase